MKIEYLKILDLRNNLLNSNPNNDTRKNPDASGKEKDFSEILKQAVKKTILGGPECSKK